MYKKVCFLLMLLWVANIGVAQVRLPKEAQALLSDLRFVEGGSFIMGLPDEHYAAPSTDTVLLLGDLERHVTVASFWMAETEVSNAQWREFYQAQRAALGEEAAKAFLPDTLRWINEFPHAYNNPMAQYYFWHPAYSDYPVVGVTWEQAQAYCEWRTNAVNAALAPYKVQVPAFRLPTEAEWEYAALGLKGAKPNERRIFPWAGNALTDEKGKYFANMGAIQDAYGFWAKDFVDDGHAYTGKVADYPANAWGLYQMAGNVREWVADAARLNAFPTNEMLNPYRNGGKSMPDSAFVEGNLLDSAVFVQQMRKHYGDRDPLYVRKKAEALRRSLLIAQGNKRIVKGGSWFDKPTYLLCGSRMAFPQNQSSTTIGFRVAMIHTGAVDQKNNPMPVIK